MSSGAKSGVSHGGQGNFQQDMAKEIADQNEKRIADELKTADTDFFGGTGHSPLPAKYKNWIGVNQRNKYMSKAKNKALKNAIGELYRPSSYIGDGGTASIVKFERKTGLKMGRNGNSHEQKAKDMIRHFQNKILAQPDLSSGDRKLAETMVKKLKKALKY